MGALILTTVIRLTWREITEANLLINQEAIKDNSFSLQQATLDYKLTI
jgi:hypothetical protein